MAVLRVTNPLDCVEFVGMLPTRAGSVVKAVSCVSKVEVARVVSDDLPPYSLLPAVTVPSDTAVMVLEPSVRLPLLNMYMENPWVTSAVDTQPIISVVTADVESVPRLGEAVADIL